MMNDLQALETRYNIPMVGNEDFLLILLGKCIPDVDYGIMMEIWSTSGQAISSMYMRVEETKPKKGIG